MLKIITTQLSEYLPKDNLLQKFLIINPTNFKEMFDLFKSNHGSNICVYDKTFSKNHSHNKIIPVKDHINNTGINILTGHQQILNIDFIDLSNLYVNNNESVITVCCGEKLNIKEAYPSHYLCHITTLARAMKIDTIVGYLYNSKE
jgi:hypothetical protein